MLERSRAAAAAIEELRGASGDTSRVARQISLATQQQNAASDEVVMTLREVSLVVQRMTGGLKNLSSTADRLNSLGLEIQLLAQSFHLDSPRSLKHLVEDWARRLESARRRCREGAGARRAGAATRRSSSSATYRARRHARWRCAFNQDLLDERPALAGRQGARDGRAHRAPGSRRCRGTGATTLIPPYESMQNSEACFTVCTPVRDGDGSVSGGAGDRHQRHRLDEDLSRDRAETGRAQDPARGHAPAGAGRRVRRARCRWRRCGGWCGR